MDQALVNPLWPQPAPPQSCATCVWRYRDSAGQARCRRHREAPVEASWPACAAWTGELDCQTCGACCREAYHAVEVEADDPFVATHPDWLAREDDRWVVRREGPRCAALACCGPRYACALYDARPQTCRDFEQGGENCVIARRRVGLTP